MKRILAVLLVVMLLTGCETETPVAECEFTYEMNELIFEVNETLINYDNAITSNCTYEIDDSAVDYTTVGVYQTDVILTNSDASTTNRSVGVVVEDSEAPEIIVPENFKENWNFGEEFSIEGIIVNDNSNNNIPVTYRLLKTSIENQYRVYLEATDQSGNSGVFEFYITFEDYVKPIVTFEVVEITPNEFEIKYNIIDPSEVVSSVMLKITDGGEIDTQQLMGGLSDIIRKTGLKSDSNYIVELEITYEDIVSNTKLELSTMSYEVPSIELLEEFIGVNQYKVEFVMTNPNLLVTDLTIELESADNTITKVSNNVDDSHQVFIFDNLESVENYIVRYILSYDLLDGFGIKTVTETSVIDTLEIGISGVLVNPTSIIGEGYIHMELLLDNPNDLVIEEVIVNEQYVLNVELYDSYLNFDYFYPNNFTDLELFIEEFITNTGISIPINKEIMFSSIEEIQVLNINNLLSNQYQIDEEMVFTIELENPNGLEITGIQLNGELYLKSSNDVSVSMDNTSVTLILPATSEFGVNDLNITEIHYLIDETAYISIVEKHYYYYIGDFNNPINISSCTELYNTIFENDDSVYFLTDNIDCENTSHLPINPAPNYLNGNGYEISNVMLTTELGTFGLFNFLQPYSMIENLSLNHLNFPTSSYAISSYGTLAVRSDGVIKDVNIDGVYILMDSSSWFSEIGGVVSNGQHTIFINVNVEAYFIISYLGMDSDATVGGLAAICFDCKFEDSSFIGILDVDSYFALSAGGFIGSGSVDIYNSYVNAEISASASITHVGGFSGQQQSGSIKNSYTAGSINIHGCNRYCVVGGFVGGWVNPTVRNAFVANDITADYNGYITSPNYVGGLIGRTYESSITLVDKVLVFNNISVSGPYDENIEIFIGEVFGDIYESQLFQIYVDPNRVITISENIALMESNKEGEIIIEELEIEKYVNPIYIEKTLQFDKNIWDLTPVKTGLLPKLNKLEEADVVIFEN